MKKGNLHDRLTPYEEGDKEGLATAFETLINKCHREHASYLDTIAERDGRYYRCTFILQEVTEKIKGGKEHVYQQNTF